MLALGGTLTPTVLVGTHLDQCSSDADLLSFEEAVAGMFPKSSFYFLKERLFVSCKSGEGIADLKKRITRLAEKSDFLPMVPKSWVRLHDLLETKAGRAGASSRQGSSSVIQDLLTRDVPNHVKSDVIFWEEFCKCASQCEVSRAEPVAEFLTSVGSIISMQDFKSNANKIIILNPQWLADLIITLTTAKTPQVTKGLFLLRDIPKVFKDYEPSLHMALLLLLEKFSTIIFVQLSAIGFSPDLSVSSGGFPLSPRGAGLLSPRGSALSLVQELPQLRHSSSQSSFPQTFQPPPLQSGQTSGNLFSLTSDDQSGILVPSLLVSDMSLKKISSVWAPNYQSTYQEQGRIYRFNMLPVGFFAQVISGILHLPNVKGLLIWDNGLIVEYSPKFDTEGVMVLKQYGFFLLLGEESEFTIRIRVPRAQQFSDDLLLVNIVAIIETILEKSLCEVYRYIPCTHCIEKRNQKITNATRTEKTNYRYLSWHFNEGLYEFGYQEIIQTILANHRVVFCNQIQSQSRRVRLVELVPDLCLASVPVIDQQLLNFGPEVGHGAFGKVLKAEFLLKGREPITVAVKRERDDEGQHWSKFLEFHSEVQVMSKIRHPNVLQLIGISFSPLQMILEFVPHKDLFEIIHPPSAQVDKENLYSSNLSQILDEDFPWYERLLICFDIARGMLELHSHSPPIIHRDLRTANIFIMCRGTDPNVIHAKVADFGLARFVAGSMRGSLESWRWLPPELSMDNYSYDCSADVYSFAIVLWEIGSKSYPFDEFIRHPEFSYLNKDGTTRVMLEDKVKNAAVYQNLRPSLDLIPLKSDHIVSLEDYDGAPREFVDLISQCWSSNPADRPTFQYITEKFGELLNVPAESRKLSPLGGSFRSVSFTNFNNSSEVLGNLWAPAHPNHKNVEHDLSKTMGIVMKNIFSVDYQICCGCLVEKPSRFNPVECVWVGTNDGKVLIADITEVGFFS
jgi:serine/threonine protein kinase